MRFEILLPFIIPLTFLAIWLLAALSIRGGQPLLPRPTPWPGPNGWRPAQQPLQLRFTLKQLMLAVAILCLFLAAVKAYRESEFAKLAAYHAREEATWRRSSKGWPSAEQLADYHGFMRHVYQQAKWLTIIPNVPVPRMLPPPPLPLPILPRPKAGRSHGEKIFTPPPVPQPKSSSSTMHVTS